MLFRYSNLHNFSNALLLNRDSLLRQWNCDFTASDPFPLRVLSMLLEHWVRDSDSSCPTTEHVIAEVAHHLFEVGSSSLSISDASDCPPKSHTILQGIYASLASD